MIKYKIKELILKALPGICDLSVFAILFCLSFELIKVILSRPEAEKNILIFLVGACFGIYYSAKAGARTYYKVLDWVIKRRN